LGLGPDSTMALALGKRLRELMVGLPGLFYWFLMQGRGHRPSINGREA
jgi:hypothetical protein